MSQTSKQKKQAAKSRRKQAERTAEKKKQEGGIHPLTQQLSQTQGALMNLRNMYDQKVMETEALRQAIQSKDRLLAAIVSTRRGGTVTIPKSAFGKVVAGEYAGLNVEETDEKLTLTIVKTEEWQDASEGE